MPDPVEIIVENDPKPTQNKGDWTLRIGRGQGGKIVSSHRSKASAIRAGRVEGRKRDDTSRGAVLLVQNASGRGREKVEGRYGKAKEANVGGLFGFGLF